MKVNRSKWRKRKRNSDLCSLCSLLFIREGRVALGSVNTAPLRVKPLFDPSLFERQPMP